MRRLPRTETSRVMWYYLHSAQTKTAQIYFMFRRVTNLSKEVHCIVFERFWLVDFYIMRRVSAECIAGYCGRGERVKVTWIASSAGILLSPGIQRLLSSRSRGRRAVSAIWTHETRQLRHQRLSHRLLGRCPRRRGPEMFGPSVVWHRSARHGAAQPSALPQGSLCLPGGQLQLRQRWVAPSILVLDVLWHCDVDKSIIHTSVGLF